MTSWLLPTRTLPTALYLACAVMTTSCSKEISSTELHDEPNSEWSYLTQEEIDTRLSKMGNGPFKIGTPKKNYASHHTKVTFDLYDKNMRFTEIRRAGGNPDSDICDFTKAAMFSDEIDLSTFYWQHPKTETGLVKKIDDLNYLLKEDPAFLFSFSFDDQFVPSNDKRPKTLNVMNSMFGLCNIGTNPKWNFALSKFENLQNRKSISCDYEYSPELELKTIFNRDYMGSTIGFFVHQNNIYLISVQLIDYDSIGSSGMDRSLVAVATSKVLFDRNTAKINTFTSSCIYYGKVVEKTLP